MRTRKASIVTGAVLAGALAAFAAAQTGGSGATGTGTGTGNPGNSGSTPSGPTSPTGTITAPEQPTGSVPNGLPPSGPSNEQPGTGAATPAQPTDLGAPGQPGGAPPCPADNPACNPNNPASPTDSTRRADGSAVPTPQQNRSADTDGRLTSRVREGLLRGNLSQPAGLSVTSAGGKVTLRGMVSSEQQKADLVRRATAVAGDGNVIDEMTVAP
jgi:hypothetical protein